MSEEVCLKYDLCAIFRSELSSSRGRDLFAEIYVVCYTIVYILLYTQDQNVQI